MERDTDDVLIGRVLTRREVLILLGAAGTAAALAACQPSSTGIATGSATGSPATSASASASAVASTAGPTVSAAPACVVRPELTEGPYFVDEKLLRSDITKDSDGTVKEGLPLSLGFAVYRVTGSSCMPFVGALVDVWHCDALGVYSDVQDPGFNSTGQDWLRGYQVSDTNGLVRFTTIYPGWYQGRAVHIHFKIRTDASAGSSMEFTSQLFFDDTVSDQVFARQPYAAKGQRTLRNDGDGIFNGGGDRLVLSLTGDATTGFSTVFDIGVVAN